MSKVAIQIVEIGESSAKGGNHTLIMKEVMGDRRLPIVIGGFEALAIHDAVYAIKRPRPMTHDLIKTIIEYLSATVLEVVIDELRENIFYAKIVLEIASMEHQIDARPSDAIAIAIRFNAPIYCSEDVMQSAGIMPSSKSVNNLTNDNSSENDSGNEIKFGSKLALLHTQLREALAKEDYERAAKLRDEIRNIEKKSTKN